MILNLYKDDFYLFFDVGLVESLEILKKIQIQLNPKY